MTRIALFILLGELLVLLGGGPLPPRHGSNGAEVSAVTPHVTAARLPRTARAKPSADARGGEHMVTTLAAPPPVVVGAASERVRVALDSSSVTDMTAPLPCARGPPMRG